MGEKKLKALLINPQYPETFWNFKYALKFIRKKAAYPPLGLITVAALLPKQWQKKLVDLNVSRLRDQDLKWADYIFISAMVVQKESVLKLVARCKKAGCKIIAGGPLFNTEYEEFKDIDHFVLNEAELTVPLFLKDLQKGKAKRIYSSTDFADLTKSPLPLWELVDLKKYASVSLQFSRGCPYNCDFCYVTTLFGHRLRNKTSAQIIKELNLLYGLGWRGKIFFVDDNFIANKHYLKNDLLPRLIAWQKDKKGIGFTTQTTVNLADDGQLLQLMHAAGFLSVFIGIETVNKKSLVECQKNQNKNRNLVKDVKTIQQAGIEVWGGFIVGFDSDTSSVFQRQIDFIQKSGVVVAMVGLLTALKDTRLYHRLKQENRLLMQSTGDNADGSLNFVTVMDNNKMKEGFYKIIENIYAVKAYYKRIKTLLKELNPPKIKESISWQHLLAFLQSIYYFGILSRERFHYWSLLIWTIFHRPRLLPTAVTEIIWGYHFRKTYAQHII